MSKNFDLDRYDRLCSEGGITEPYQPAWDLLSDALVEVRRQRTMINAAGREIERLSEELSQTYDQLHTLLNAR